MQLLSQKVNQLKISEIKSLSMKVSQLDITSD